MYACRNYQNRSFVGITARAAGRFGGARIGTGVSGVGKTGLGLPKAVVAPILLEGGAKIFVCEEIELFERVDLLEPLADCLKLSAVSLLATLWAVVSRKKA